jgi:hypothetical protein
MNLVKYLGEVKANHRRQQTSNVVFLMAEKRRKTALQTADGLFPVARESIPPAHRGRMARGAPLRQI